VTENTPLPIPERALAVGAHPDDIEFGAGGTLAAWAQAGCEVTMVVMTDGSKGSWDPKTDPVELAELRAREQKAAAKQLGASEVVFLGHPDGVFEYTLEVRAEVARLVRIHRPDVMFSHDPWAPYEIHPDHRATGWAAVDGALAARDPLFFPEQKLEPHRPDSLLLWKPAQADYWEDVGGTLDQKIAALLAHQSQHHTSMLDAGAAFEERVRDWAADQGEAVDLAAAEAFKRLEL
jgi:LmbE family N-acetylglucosaminyl deacetylase